jgi:arylsulfatase A-like enzyme
MKSPLVVAGPGIAHGSSDALVYLLDIYPTLCDLAGLPVPPRIDGRSFRAVLDGKSATARSELFLSYMAVQRAVRDDRWKLIRYPQVNATQLFDLAADPDETNNLASDPAHEPRVRSMLARLATLQTEWGDTAPLTVANPKPAEWHPPKSN